MASATIHLAVAKELEKNFNLRNKKDYYLGAIAPDISKQIGNTKEVSHFLYNTKKDVPNINMFRSKYEDFQDNDFTLGYFIHLYTDKIWFDNFIEKLAYSDSVKLLDGTVLVTTEEEIRRLVYQDYTNLNIQIIDEYGLDLSLFYEDFRVPETSFEEIPVEKLGILVDQMGVIIENSKQEKNYIFDIILIRGFIADCVEKILQELKNY